MFFRFCFCGQVSPTRTSIAGGKRILSLLRIPIWLQLEQWTAWRYCDREPIVLHKGRHMQLMISKCKRNHIFFEWDGPCYYFGWLQLTRQWPCWSSPNRKMSAVPEICLSELRRDFLASVGITYAVFRIAKSRLRLPQQAQTWFCWFGFLFGPQAD